MAGSIPHHDTPCRLVPALVIGFTAMVMPFMTLLTFGLLLAMISMLITVLLIELLSFFPVVLFARNRSKTSCHKAGTEN